MHIAYIHQYFATPSGATGTRSYEFARRWVGDGHRVTMLTTTAQLAEDDLKSAKGLLIKRFTVDGINVFALAVTYRQQMGFFLRCLAFAGFVIGSSLLVLFLRDIDVAYATSTPLTVGIPALVGKWIRRTPFVFEVRDQWPEIPIELGIIKNKILVKSLLWLEKTIYKNSSAIIAGSPGQAESIRSVYSRQKALEVIPNSCDTNVFRPDIDSSIIQKKYGWENKFVLLHAGAMGRVNSLDFVIDAAVKLRDHPNILFVLIGDGSQKPHLLNRIKQLGLKNVQILPAVPKKDMPKVMVATDVGLVIIGNYPILEHNSANKFFDSLSSGLPVLLNYRGWKAALLEENDAGFGCKLYDVDEFAEKILYLNSHREKLAEMGQNARRLAEERFNKTKLAMEALNVVYSVEI